MEPNVSGSGAPTPPRTPCGGSSGEEDVSAAVAAAGCEASPCSPPSPKIVVGFGVPPSSSSCSSAGERAAARRRKAPGKPADSPLAALLRSRNTSFPSLPALKTKLPASSSASLSLASASTSGRTPTPPPGSVAPCSAAARDASPCSSNARRTRSYSDLSGCSTPLSRSSDPIAIPPAR